MGLKFLINQPIMSIRAHFGLKFFCRMTMSMYSKGEYMGVAIDIMDKIIQVLEQLLAETDDEIQKQYIEAEIYRLKKFKDLISEE